MPAFVVARRAPVFDPIELIAKPAERRIGALKQVGELVVQVADSTLVVSGNCSMKFLLLSRELRLDGAKVLNSRKELLHAASLGRYAGGLG